MCGQKVHEPFRIIPARAGFTSRPRPRPLPPWDHPRSRGVYVHIILAVSLIAGSSPLARGLLNIVGGEYSVSGIIPARAGFTKSRQAPSCHGADHPRSRGVYLSCAVSTTSLTGSSPLARGLHNRSPEGQGGRRIIPARAGFTAWLNSSAVISPDHPRSRGVYVTRRPRRGTVSRIIPARAGFTSSFP